MDFSDLREPAPAPWGERPTHVVLQGVVGSRAYGLAHQNSDHDRRGVFLAPSLEFFGLEEPAQSADNPHADEVLHELGKFVRMALKANPAVLELLWLSDYEILTPVGEQLIQLRWALLSAERVRAAYLGAANSMLADIRKGGKRTAKAARHLARLLITGEALWRTGVLRPRLQDPDAVRAFGEQVAAGDVAAAQAMLADYEQRFAATPTVLPEQADRARVDTWLKQVRYYVLTVQAA